MGTRVIVSVCVALASMVVHGQGRDTHVPKDLQDWQAWVLHGEEHRRCPFVYDSAGAKRGDFLCAWPGELDLSVTAGGGRFEQAWTVYGDDQWVPLPGDEKVWPRDVTVGRKRAEVVLHDGSPSIRLTPGRHRIGGAFAWDERPAALEVPGQIGLLALTVDGQRIALPRRTDQGLWLGEGEPTEAIMDELSMNVFRRIADDVPTRLESVFEINVAGTVREERFAPALPEGFVPLSLESELPVRLSPDGAPGGGLEAQVRPGTWRITLLARAAGVTDSVTMSQGVSNLPATEIWSYQGNPQLRATLAEAPRAADPTQVGSPWRNLPAFRVEPGESLVVVERSRGLAETGNSLFLDRRLWLDFDGEGFVFADAVTGTMRHSWRLDMAAPYALMNAREQGETLLVTRNDALEGVEVRNANLHVDALGRIDTRGEVPVAGWQADLTTMSATLNVPPGHRLLAAIGVDDAPSSWIGRWQLLDFFLLLIITLATARLFGRVAGAVALLAMALCFHEPLAPLWTWLNLLAAVALVRVAPPGRLRSVAKGYRVTSFVVLLLFLVPFAVGQIRIAIFPQLESPAHRHDDAQSWGLFEMLAGRGPPALPSRAKSDQRERVAYAVAADRATEPIALSRYDDSVLLQTGPGKPNWDWRSYSLSWSGPVDVDRSMRLVILPDWLVSALRLAAVVALGLFAALFAFDIANRRWQWRLPTRKTAASGATSAVLLAVALVGAEPASAQPPSPEVLDELKERLLAPPPCAPRCAEVVGAEVEVGEETMTIHLEVHAMEDVAVPMPGTAEGWRPQRIIAGGSGLATHQDAQRVLWVHLAAGRHALTLEGPLPPGDTLEIPFAAPPRDIAVRSEHWFVAGIQNRILPAGALNLTRLRQEGDTDTVARWEPSRLPVFLRVERLIRLDLDWGIASVARRVAPETGALNVEVPLLDGEAVLDENVAVGADGVLVSMDPTAQQFAWHSTLPRQSSMTLRAPMDRPWQEVWRFAIGSEWKVEFDGVPESLPDAHVIGRHRVFHPRPGENLTVSVSRPEAVGGETLAFDNVNVSTRVGAHQHSSVMAIDYRSTRGRSHVIRLPAQAEVEFVRIDGRSAPIVAADGEVTVPILPGEHALAIAWKQAGRPGLRVRTPEVGLGAQSGNLVSELAMPSNRWLLFTRGPDLGPAVLYWSELVALIGASLILGRLKWTPLRTHHWLLLGLGFSTSSWFALGVVVVWLLAHGSRRSWGASLSESVYRLTQIGFGALTLAAFAAIVAGVGVGLLGNPDMHVTGYESAPSELRWFADRTDDAIPQASVWSVPLWSYKVLILAWALWLSLALVRWLPWVWQCFAGLGLWYRQAKPSEGTESGD